RPNSAHRISAKGPHAPGFVALTLECSLLPGLTTMRSLILVIACLLITPLLRGQHPSTSPSPSSQQAQGSADCSEDASKLPRGTTRIFVGQQGGRDGSGRSANDARDGSSAEKFDRILRCYSEGCAAGSGEKAVPKTENLIVCIGPGHFQTKGRYDFVINVPHR